MVSATGVGGWMSQYNFPQQDSTNLKFHNLSQTASQARDQVFKHEPMGEICHSDHSCSLSALVIDQRIEHELKLLL